MQKIICGIQQVGIGVRHLGTAWSWYRRLFRMDLPVFDDAAPATLMADYTGGTPHQRHAVLALNPLGGAGFEVWQFTDRVPLGPAFTPQVGDLGILATRLKAPDVAAAHRHFRHYAPDRTSQLLQAPDGSPHCLVQDPFDNWFQAVPGEEWFRRRGAPCGGVAGALIGVSDMAAARQLYSDVLGFDTVVYDETGTFEDWASLPGGHQRYRRVLLSHQQPRQGAFSRYLGAAQVELVQALDRAPRRLYENRFWGDLGFIHLCFDVRHMDALEAECAAAGFPFRVNSQQGFDMGQAAGHFAYIEDPDGTLIEFVETHRMPILKRWGIYLHLQRRAPEQPLPDWMLRLLALNRVKA